MTNFEMLHKKMLNGEKIDLNLVCSNVSITVADATDVSNYTAEELANDIAKAFAKKCLEWENKEAE